MSEHTKILLSAAIIFKNEIRCLERCLKAFQPLRSIIPFEIVMADTGSDDGSREIAEKYADIVIDFPWINDFAAARNAVLDRCSGKWCLVVDSDEWLDNDVTQLVEFLHSAGDEQIAAPVLIRNYRTYEVDSNYADFMGIRLLRMSTGIRYRGAIHEALPIPPNTVLTPLLKTILHHDGYVGFGSESGKSKVERNVTLLREKLKNEPNNLLVRLQMIESGWAEKDYLHQIRQSVAMVREKRPHWEILGPPILRYAVNTAYAQHMKEADKWVAVAEEWFPNSYYTRIDIEGQRVLNSWEKQDFADCISRGKKCLEAYADYRAGRGEIGGLLYSTLKLAPIIHEQTIRLIVANAYLGMGQLEEIPKLMADLDYSQMDEQQIKNSVFTLRDLHSRSDFDTRPLLEAAWEELNREVPSRNRAQRRRFTFLSAGSTVFHHAHCENEAKHELFCRHAYTMFLPLAGKCALGTAAAMMVTEDPGNLRSLSAMVENWLEIPAFALAHALRSGMPFPLPESPLKLEVMDQLATRLSGCENPFQLLERTMEDGVETSQALAWKRGLVLALIRTNNWKSGAYSMELMRYFIQAERQFLPLCYTQGSL